MRTKEDSNYNRARPNEASDFICTVINMIGIIIYAWRHTQILAVRDILVHVFNLSRQEVAIHLKHVNDREGDEMIFLRSCNA